MSFRLQKRIKLGGGLGLNVSKSGIYPSLKTKRGTISSKGFSVRTGVSGVTYGKKFSQAKNSGCLLLFVLSLTITVIIKQLWL